MSTTLTIRVNDKRHNGRKEGGHKCPRCPAVYPTRNTLLEHIRTSLCNRKVIAFQPSESQISRIQEHITQPYQEDEFYPVLLYRGQADIGRAKTMYNYFAASMEQETKSISSMHFRSEANRPGYPVAHLTGSHAWVIGEKVLHHWGSRFLQHPELLARTPHLREYIEYLRDEGGLKLAHLSPIPRFSPHPATKYGIKPWRYQYQRIVSQPIAQFWPFVGEYTAPDLDGLDMLQAVDAVVPRSIPSQVREDLCQDLIVSLLTREFELHNLIDALPQFVKKAFRQYPIKYGNALSIDAKAAWSDDADMTLSRSLRGQSVSDGMCDRCETFSEDLKDWYCERCWFVREKEIQNMVLAGTPGYFAAGHHSRHHGSYAFDGDVSEWAELAGEDVSPTDRTPHPQGRMAKVERDDDDEFIVGPRPIRSNSTAGGGRNTKLLGVDWDYTPRNKRRMPRKGDEWRGNEEELSHGS